MAKQVIRPPIVGWREWISLPDLKIDHIKAKIDTGARTSALHAYFVEPFLKSGRRWVRFGVHPYQQDNRTQRICEVAVTDVRWVTDSGGHREKRYVITTDLELGDSRFPVELTLTNRDTMRFRMLLGRTAIADNFLVDSGSTMQMGRPSSKPAPHAFVGGHYDEEE